MVKRVKERERKESETRRSDWNLKIAPWLPRQFNLIAPTNFCAQEFEFVFSQSFYQAEVKLSIKFGTKKRYQSSFMLVGVSLEGNLRLRPKSLSFILLCIIMHLFPPWRPVCKMAFHTFLTPQTPDDIWWPHTGQRMNERKAGGGWGNNTEAFSELNEWLVGGQCSEDSRGIHILLSTWAQLP